MTEFSFRTRQQNLQRLANEEFDLLVIGGGIHGAGVARDAAMRGLKVALVEKGDYASGTSSKSSKLIHGGLRYLEHAEFGLVFESLRERSILLRIAPHLVKPLPFLFPIYEGDRPPWMVRTGMILYETLSAFRNVGRHRMLSAAEALREEPALKPDGLRGAAEYWDCQEDDARFCLANVVDAAANGAVCANYVGVEQFGSRSGNLVSATVRDRISDSRLEIRAKAFVNAGGPWVDKIAALDKSSLGLRPTKGIHLVTRRLTQGHALLLQSKEDRRVFFVLPWGSQHSLIGTTDTDFSGSPDQVEADSHDVEYLLAEANRSLPTVRLGEKDVLATFAGLRPLLQQAGRKPSDVTRKHKLSVSENGLISIIGGKYTTYRAVAEEVVDLACQRVKGKAPPCKTATEALAPEFPAELIEAAPTFSLVDAVRRAVDHEMAMTPGDVLFRRTTVGYTKPEIESVATLVADEMQKRLGWAEDEKSRQLQRLA